MKDTRSEKTAEKRTPLLFVYANIGKRKINEEDSVVKKSAAAYLGLVFAFVIWGSLYVVSSIVLRYVPTFAVMFCRFANAFVTLSIILKAETRRSHHESIDGQKTNFTAPEGDSRERKTNLAAPERDSRERKTRLDRRGWKYVLLMGVLGYAVGAGIQLIGTKYAGSSMASLINSLNPVTISIMAIPILHEKLTSNKITGILMAVFGVYLILGTGGSFNLPGTLMSILSVLLWSLVSVLTRQGLSEYNPLVVTRSAIGIAAVCDFIFAVIEHFITHSPIQINAGVITGLLYMGIFCTGIAYILWNQGLAALPASNCSALYPIQPLTSTVMGVIFFHETVGLSFAAGAAFIVIGVLLCLLGGMLFSRRKRADQDGA